MLISWLALALCIVSGAGGNILGKISRRRTGRQRHLLVLASVGLYGFGLLGYPISMVNLPLAVAYPALIVGKPA